MPRVLFVCTMIVAALQHPLAAAGPIVVRAIAAARNTSAEGDVSAKSAASTLPLPPPVAAYARSIGLDLARDQARLLPTLVRVLYTPPESHPSDALASLRDGLSAAGGERRERRRRDDPSGAPDEPDAGGPPVLVPVPLPADVWDRAVFRRPVPPADLVSAIVLDRSASLLCYGLAGLDDETLAYLGDHPAILTRLYERAAPAFAAFGASLRVHGDRVVPPGGDLAAPLWEAATVESLAKPDRFIRALFENDDGRVAYLFDRAAALDPPHAAFVVGAWMPDRALRAERFAALAGAVSRGYREWHINDLPFSRPLNDLGMLLFRLRVMPSGEPAAPAGRAFWASVFESGDAPLDAISTSASSATPRAAPARPAPAAAAGPALIDAAFLSDVTDTGDFYWRGDRLDQLAFGQRLFAGLSDPAAIRDAAAVLRALPRHRMLLWSLERMGVRDVGVMAAAVRQARAASSGGANDVFWTLADLQGGLALVGRMRAAGTIDDAAAERLVRTLCAIPAASDDSRYGEAVARWISTDLVRLMPVTPPGTDVEDRLIAGAAGPVPGAAAPRVFWEGQAYRLDFASAERRRLAAVREKQHAVSIDQALALYRVAGALAADRLEMPEVRALSGELGAVAITIPQRPSQSEAELMVPGVRAPRAPREAVDRVVSDLAKAALGSDPRRAARLAPALVEAANVVLGEALLSLVYAFDLGEPDSTALLASNVALRHDFGLAIRDSEGRARRMWDVPRQDFQPGMPWRVTGSLLGLDVALAPMALRRISLDGVANAPRLQANEREEFAVGTALMNPRLLRDGDRDALVAAIGRGTARLRALGALAAGGADRAREAAAVADETGLDGWRRRALSWSLDHEPSQLPAAFSLAELVTLGGGATGVDLDAWGTSGMRAFGCACTRYGTPASWTLLGGHAQVALIGTIVPDLNLRVAMLLSDLGLPAALERPVLAAAMQDFIYETSPTDVGDWWTPSRSARALARRQVEDYVAAAAAVYGPLIPEDEPGQADDAGAPGAPGKPDEP